jgi:hypothetical protein
MRTLKIKQVKAPPVARTTGEATNLARLTAISRYNFIVGQLRERGKTYNDLSQLPISLQEIRKTPQRTSTLSL